jgi:SAM-dependent methyltransferase
MFFPDKPSSFKEASRVLKPNGSYRFNVWGPWESNPFARIVHETVERFFPDNPPEFYRVPFGYHDADEIRESLRDAGFAEVAVDDVPLTSTIRSADVFARGPLYQQVIDRGGNPEAICEVVSEAIRDHLGSEMPLKALFVCASKVPGLY